MNSKTENPAPAFNPIHIVLTSPEDVAKMYAMFNEPILARARQLRDDMWKQLQDVNRAVGNPDFDAGPWDSALDKGLARCNY